MTVTIYIPSVLRAYCQGAPAELVVSASTVGGALRQIELNHPTLYRSICDETGAVRRHVHLFVNSSLVCGHEGLNVALAPGDALSIMPAVSGG